MTEEAAGLSEVKSAPALSRSGGKRKKQKNVDEKAARWIKTNIKRIKSDDTDATDSGRVKQLPPDHGGVLFQGATRRAKGQV